MAEAVVEERTRIPSRFYCHMCDREFTLNNSDYTCPICSTGFIEEVQAQSPAPQPATTNSVTFLGTANANGVLGQSGTVLTASDSGQRMNDLIRDEISSMLSRNFAPPTTSADGSSEPRTLANLLTLHNASGNSSGSSNGGGGSRNRRRQLNFDRIDTVLFEFLQSLSGDVVGPFGNSQMFFMGNPGDYAWGREGIDTIVTQLLNQMETSGPPPLAKDKIQEIPRVEVTDEEIKNQLQCSVCWEDFRLNETVRKLPCLHIYHENCIVPWLDLHGTCPICRKSLVFDGDDGNSADCPLHNSNSASTSGSQATSAVAALLNNPSTSTLVQPQQQQPPSHTPSSSSTSQSNNVFAFDDGNVDYDFD